MRHHHSYSICFLVFTLAAVFLFYGATGAQEDASGFTAKAFVGKSKGAQAFDEKAKEKLSQMSPQEVKALDEKLAKALKLFYEHEYAKALPLFQEVAARVETMDVKFWLATCARGAGRLELAIEKYKEMLEVDPDLHRVRLELAATQYQMGKFEEARKNCEKVLVANPPETVKNNIERMLVSIDEKTRRMFPHFRLGVGIQRDSNVSAGPDRSTIGTPSGGLIRLGKTQKELSDWVGVLSGAGSLVYDLGKRGGFMWNAGASVYFTRNFDYDEFDFGLWRVSTGPWWVGSRIVFKAPVGYGKAYYDDDTLYSTWDIAPSLEYFVYKWLGVRATFAYVDEDYDSRDRQGQDNINRLWEIRVNFYLNSRKDIVSVFYSDENLNAEDYGYSYDGYNLGISYFKKLPWDLECFLRYKYTDRDYHGQPGPARNFGFTGDRKDERHNFYAGLSRNFSRYCFGTLYFNYVDNDSNTPFYEFNKTIYGLQVGVKY